MRTIDDALAVGNVVDVVDKDRALFRQLVHNIAVMDNFAAHIDGRAEGVESDLDDVDSADYSSAEPSRFEQQHTLFARGSVAGAAMGTVIGDGFDGSSGHISKYTNGRVKGTGEKSRRTGLSTTATPPAGPSVRKSWQFREQIRGQFTLRGQLLH